MPKDIFGLLPAIREGSDNNNNDEKNGGITENKSEKPNHWRQLELEKRFKSRTTDGRSLALLAAGKQQVRNRRQELQIKVSDQEKRIRHLDGGTQLRIIEMEHAQAVLIRRSEQNWDINRKLRTMQQSIRNTAESQKGRQHNLDDLRVTILGLREMAEEDGRVARLTADDEVDTDLLVNEEVVKRTSACPKCRSQILNEYIESHVLSCGSLLAINNVGKSFSTPQGGPGGPGGGESARGTVAEAAGRRKVPKVQVCSSCGKKILASRMKKHMAGCALRIKNIRDKEEKLMKEQAASLATLSDAERMGKMQTQAPMDLSLLDTTCETITLSWKPPVFTGGLPVTDYIISMSLCTVLKVGKEIQRTYEAMPEVTTSRWCLSRPVARTGFTIRGLQGGREYADIKVRAVNAVGMSEFSSSIKSVTLPEARPPYPPLMLEYSAITDTSMTLIWSEPFYTGGSPLDCYEVSYKTMVVNDIRNANKNKGMRKSKMLVARTKGAQCELLIDKLESNTKYFDISVVALNKTGFISESSNKIIQVQTLMPSELDLVKQELRRVSLAKGNFVDASLHEGLTQRVSKEEYINKLTKDLKKLEESKETEKQMEDIDATAMGTGTISEADAEKMRLGGTGRRGATTTRRRTLLEAHNVLHTDTFAARLRKFDYRIRKLVEEEKHIEAQRSVAVIDRAGTTRDLDNIQKRIYELQAEFDRASVFKGKYIDSTVVHGRMQRFEIKSLQLSLETSLEDALERLAQGKRAMINLHDSLKEYDVRGKELKITVAERKVAMQKFAKETEGKIQAVQNISNWRMKGVQKCFEAFRKNWISRKKSRVLLSRFFVKIDNMYVSRAWETWKLFLISIETEKSSHSTVSGVGSYMLKRTLLHRTELAQASMHELQLLGNTSHRLEESQRTNSQIIAFKQSVFYDEDKEDHDSFRRTFAGFAQMAATYRQGGVLLERGDLDGSFALYAKHRQLGREIDDIGEQSKAFRGMGDCLRVGKKLDKAIVHYDRARSLANEYGSKLLEAEALLGVAAAYFEQGMFNAASASAETALVHYEDTNDKVGELRTSRLLADAYKGLVDYDKVASFTARGDLIEYEMRDKLVETWKRIGDAEKKLVNVTAEQSNMVELELVSASVPSLRAAIEHTRTEAERIDKLMTDEKEENATLQTRYSRVVESLAEADACQADEMDSDLVHGTHQRFRVKELRIVLATEKGKLEKRIEEIGLEIDKMSIRLNNLEDDMHEISLTLKVELGSLMRHVMMKRSVRCAALNESNLKGNDVKGQAICGIDKFVCASNNTLFVFELNDGALSRVIQGGSKKISYLDVGDDVADSVMTKEEKKYLLERGHVGTITALHFSDRQVFSGGTDCHIRVWDAIEEFECKAVLRGSEGTIWDIKSDAKRLVSGSADNCIRVWLRETWICVGVLRGHNRTVRCLSMGGFGMLASGSSDCEIRVWNTQSLIEENSKNEVAGEGALRALLGTGYVTGVDSTIRMVGHNCPVNLVRLKGTELVSGGVDGKIIVWNASTGAIMRECTGHTGPVTSLQFDATKIVSGGADGDIRIFDIAVGECLNTLRGHESAILSLQYDNHMIVTVSTDNSFREWDWQKRGMEDKKKKNKVKKKMHMVEPGETLQLFEKRYNTTIESLQRWNRVVTNDDLYVGMRLIVQRSEEDEEESALSKRKTERSRAKAARVSKMDEERRKKRLAQKMEKLMIEE